MSIIEKSEGGYDENDSERREQPTDRLLTDGGDTVREGTENKTKGGCDGGRTTDTTTTGQPEPPTDSRSQRDSDGSPHKRVLEEEIPSPD